MLIRRAYSGGAGGGDGHLFVAPWFEHYALAATVPAFVSVGGTGANANDHVRFESPLVITQNSAGSYHAKRFLELNNVGHVDIINPSGIGWANLDAIVYAPASYTPAVYLQDHGLFTGLTLTYPTSVGVPAFHNLDGLEASIALKQNPHSSVIRRSGGPCD